MSGLPVSIKGIVLCNHRILLLQNDRQEWELPGGRMEYGESPEETVRREIAEETGLAVVPGTLVDAWVYQVMPGKKVLILTYGCGEVKEEQVDISDEHTAVGWFLPEQIDSLPMPHGYKISIQRWLTMRDQGMDHSTIALGYSELIHETKAEWKAESNRFRYIVREGTEETAEYLRQQLFEYNRRMDSGAGMTKIEPIYLSVETEEGQTIGGLAATADRHWGRCQIEVLWINDGYRNQGYGRELLQKMEEIAVAKGCSMVMLDTFSFQAPEFYLKNGYKIVGVIEGASEIKSRYAFKKNL